VGQIGVSAVSTEGQDEADVLASTRAGGAAVRGGAMRVGVYVVNAALSAGSAALLFRHLGVTGAGYYVTALSIVAVVSGVSDLGLTLLGVRELSVRHGPSRAELVTNLMGLRLTLSLAGGVVATVFALLAGYPRALYLGVSVAGVGVVLQSLQDGLTISLQTRLKLGWVALAELLRQVLAVSLVVTLVLVGAGLVPFLAVPIPVGLVIIALTAYLVRDDVPLRPRFDRREWVRMVRQILPYSAAVALGVIYFRVTIIALSLISSALQVGYFGISFRVVEVLIGVPALVVGAAFPIFSRSASDDHERLSYAVDRVLQVSLIVGVWLGLCMVLGADVAISIIGGRQAAPAAEVLRIEAIAVVASFVSTVWNLTLLSLGRYRDLMFISMGALGAGLVLSCVLSAVAGADGAAVASAIAEVGIALGCARALARARPGLLPSGAMVARVIGCAAVTGLVGLVPGVSQVLLAAAASILYFMLILTTGALPDEITAELGRLWARRPGGAGA